MLRIVFPNFIMFFRTFKFGGTSRLPSMSVNTMLKKIRTQRSSYSKYMLQKKKNSFLYAPWNKHKNESNSFAIPPLGIYAEGWPQLCSLHMFYCRWQSFRDLSCFLDLQGHHNHRDLYCTKGTSHQFLQQLPQAIRMHLCIIYFDHDFSPVCWKFSSALWASHLEEWKK